MLNKTRRALVVAAAAAAGLAVSAPWAAAQEVVLKLHQFLPSQANVPKHILDPWADKVEADSGGRIKIERYPAMQLGGKPPELIDQAIDGVADIIWTLPGYTPGRFPRAEVFELPFMMTDAEATSKAYYDLYERHMKDADFKDVHVLSVWVHGPGVIHTKDPVRMVGDLSGVKLRAPTRVTTGLFADLGATPVGMPVPAVTEALSKGVIDGTVIPWEVTPALKIAELVGNHTEFEGAPLYTAAFVFAMNKARYESLPDDLKKVIDDNSGRDFAGFAGRTMQDYDAPGRAIAADAGNTIITLGDADIAGWKEAASGVEAKWIAEMAEKGIDGKALVEEAKALIAQHSN